MKHSSLFLHIVIIAALIVFAGCKSATDTSNTKVKVKSITGTVTATSNGVFLPGVKIRLSNPDSLETVTDATGQYEFDDVPGGSYTVSTEKAGYFTQSQTINLPAGGGYIVDFKLGLEAVLQIRVLDGDGLLPIPGASIEISGGSIVTTDASGNARVSFSSANSPVSVRAFAHDYLDAFDSVTLTLGSTKFDTLIIRKFQRTLVASYMFHGDAADSSGNAHNGTQHGCTYVADRFSHASQAIQFNGTTDYISIADAADLNFGKTTDFTICLWAKYSLPQGASEIYLVRKGTNISNVYLGYGAEFIGNRYYVGGEAGTNYGTLYVTEELGGDARWHFITLVFSRKGQISYYFDGALFTQSNGDPTVMTGNINTTSPLLIGGTGATKFAFKGQLDDIRIYSAGLNGDAINTLYHENG